MITFEKTRTVLDLVVFQEDKELNAHGSCFFILPSHLFPEFEGRLATPGILPEQTSEPTVVTSQGSSP